MQSCSPSQWGFFVSGSEEVESSSPGFTEPRRLTAGFESNFALSIHTKENLAFYASDRNGNMDIWAKKLTGGTARQVTFHPADDYSPSISPNGSYLAFISRRSDANGDLYIMDLGIQFKNYLAENEGNSETIALPLTIEQNPTWFPDNERILFESIEPTNPETPRLMVADIRTKTPLPFHNLSGRNPRISPDGTFVSYMRDNAIFLFDLVKEKEFQLTDGQIYIDGQPSFHKSGQGIYFIRFSEDSNKDRIMSGDDLPTIWFLKFSFKDEKINVSSPYPITSARYSGFYPEHNDEEIYFTMVNNNTLDVFSLPESGHIKNIDDLEKITMTSWSLEDQRYFYRRAAMHYQEHKRESDAITVLKREQFLNAKSGKEKEAEILNKIVSRNKNLEKGTKEYFRVLAIEARLGDYLFPQKSENLSYNLTRQERTFISSLQELYESSSELMTATERLLARVTATFEDTNRALPHLDRILETPGLDAQSYAVTRGLKAQMLCAQKEFDSALLLFRELVNESPEEELIIVQTADAIMQSIRSQFSDNALAEQLTRIRSQTHLPEIIRAKAHLLQVRIQLEKEQYNLAANELKIVASDYKNADGALMEAALIMVEQGDRLNIEDRSFIFGHLFEQVRHNPRYRLEMRAAYFNFLMAKASSLQKMNEHALAIKEFRVILAIDERYIPAHRGLILSAFAKRMLEEERAYYSKKARENQIDPIWNYLETYAKTFTIDTTDDLSKKVDIIAECSEEMDEIIRQDPTVAEYHLTAGWLHYQRFVWSQKYINSKTFGSRISNSWKITKSFFGFPEKDWLRESIDSYLSSLYLSQNDPTNTAHIEQNLAEAYFELKSYPEALRFYLFRIEKLQSIPTSSPEIEAQIYYNAATCAYQSDKMSLAIALQKKGLQKFNETNNNTMIELGLDRLAFYYDRSDNHANAMKIYESKLEKSEKSSDLFNHMVALGNLARSQVKAKFYEEALQNLKRYKEILQDLPDNHPGFRSATSTAFQINLGDTSTIGNRLNKDYRYLLAYTLEYEAYLGLDRSILALRSLENKHKHLLAMRRHEVGDHSKKAYLSENISIAANNLGILEYNIGQFDKSASTLYLAAQHASFLDPKSETVPKPAFTNYKNSYVALLAGYRSDREPFHIGNMADIHNETQSLINDQRLRDERDFFERIIQARLGEKKPDDSSIFRDIPRRSFVASEHKKLREDRKKILKTRQGRMAYVLQNNLPEAYLTEMNREDFTKRTLDYSERQFLDKALFQSCFRDLEKCPSYTHTYLNITNAAFLRKKITSLAINPPSETTYAVFIHNDNNLLISVFTPQKRFSILTTLDKFVGDFIAHPQISSTKRIYIHLNSSILHLINDKNINIPVAYALIGHPKEISLFEKSKRLTSTSATVLGTVNCNAFMEQGILCTNAASFEEVQAQRSTNIMILQNNILVQRQYKKVTLEKDNENISLLHSDFSKWPTLRTIIFSGQIAFTGNNWQNYFLADYLRSLSAKIASSGVPSILFAPQASSETLALYLKEEQSFPQAVAAARVKAKVIPLGFPGQTREEKIALANDIFDDAIDKAEDAYDSGDLEETSLAKRNLLFLSELIGDKNYEIETLEELVKTDFQLRRFDSALYFQKRRLGHISRDDDDYGTNLMDAAILAVRSRNTNEANTLLHETQKFYEDENDDEALGRTYYYQGLHAEQERKYQEAIQFYEKSRQYYLAVDAQMEGSQQLLHMANLYKERTNEFAKAIPLYEKARQEFEDQMEDEAVFKVSLDLGNTYIAMGQTQRAIDLLESLSRDIGDMSPESQIRLHQFLANAYYRSGQFQLAHNEVQKIYSRLTLVSSQDMRALLELDATNLQGMIVAKLGDVEKGTRILKNGLEQATYFKLEAHLATRLNNLGYLSREAGDILLSLEYFKKALVIDRKLKSRENIAFDQRNIGLSEILLGRLDRAEKELLQALKTSQELSLNYNAAYCHFGLADIQMRRNDYQGALHHFDQALSISEKSHLQDFIWKASAGRGTTLKNMKRHKDAIQAFTKAIDTIEVMRAGLTSTNAKTGFQSDVGVQSVYENLVDLYAIQKEGEKAWEISEKGRARAFIDSMGTQRVSLNDREGEKWLAQMRSLRDELEYLQISFSELSSGEEKSLVEIKIQEKTNEYHELQRTIEAHNPQLLNFTKVSTITLPEVQNMLQADQAILEYFLTEDYIHLWLISKKSFISQSVKMNRKTLEEKVAEFHNLLSNYASMRFNLNDLSQALIAPVAGALNNYKSLIVIPHAFLHHLPFAALSKTTSDNFLIDDLDVSYLESASMLRFIKLNTPIHSDSVLAIGNPDRGRDLDLPFATKEAVAISRYFPEATVLTQKHATLSEFLKLAPQATILHLASHGEFNANDPMKSRLLLAGDKGDLHVQDLFSLRLSADLVTLSACETGLGKITSGDEIIGLNRAFFFAGTGSLVSSLWRISDVASAITMKRFYRYLAEGQPRATALRHAQLLVRTYFDHPAYWAPFKLTGAI